MPTPTEGRKPRRFVPDSLDPTDSAGVSRLYDLLEARDISAPDALESFILDWEELNAVLAECRTGAYVDMTSDTRKPEYEARYATVIESIMPVAEERGFALKKKLLASPALDRLGDEYDMYLLNLRAEVAIYSPENVPLLTEDQLLDQQAEKISGAQMAEFRGEEYPLPQLARFLEETDRPTREEAWVARSEAKLKDAPAFDELYDRMLALRTRIARNAGFDNYRDYRFRDMKRFDYTPEDCVAFHEAIEKHVVPVVADDLERRRRLLGLDRLRPWDLQVDPEGNEPLRPFDSVERLEDGCERIFMKVDDELGGYFGRMIDEGLLDLGSRPGKSPGGYQESFADRGVPFIFANTVGTSRDVEAVLHEGGHSFHYFLARSRQPLYSYHNSVLEFAEVASMSMELLARPYMAEFYTPDQLERLYDEQVREALAFFPFMAMIDAFQQWVYTTEDNGPAARRAKWAELEERFRPGIDWSGLERYRNIGWQYPHVFDSPFYYVEYGIARLATFRIWLSSLEDEKGAVAAYKHALSLGGSKPLPELFQAAGAEFGMDERIVGPLVPQVRAQIKKRP